MRVASAAVQSTVSRRPAFSAFRQSPGLARFEVLVRPADRVHIASIASFSSQFSIATGRSARLGGDALHSHVPGRRGRRPSAPTAPVAADHRHHPVEQIAEIVAEIVVVPADQIRAREIAIRRRTSSRASGSSEPDRRRTPSTRSTGSNDVAGRSSRCFCPSSVMKPCTRSGCGSGDRPRSASPASRGQWKRVMSLPITWESAGQ